MNNLIEYDKQPQDFLRKAGRHIAKRIMDKIDELLVKETVPHTAKSIVGERGVFRIRIGDYRVLYRIEYEKNTIAIIKIDKRSKIYK